MVVDDEPRLRRGVEKLILSCGEEWEVIGSYNSAVECLEAFRNQEMSFDLLITDVKMPGMDGLTLIRTLKETTNFHAIVISGYDTFTFLQTAIREGASDYMIKPIDRDEFRIQLTEIKKEIISHRQKVAMIKDMESKVFELTHVKQQQKLSEFIWQQDIDLSLLEWTRDFPNGNYRLLYFSIDNISQKMETFYKEDWALWKFALNNISKEMEGQLPLTSWQWSGEDLSFWVLLHTEEERGDLPFDAVEFANELKANIKRFTPFTCSVAISREVKDLTILSNLKDELFTYIQFRLIYGGNQIFSSELVEKWNGNQKDMVSEKVLYQMKKIIFSLDNESKEHTKSQLTIFLNMMESLESPSEIKESLQLLGIKVIHYMMNHTQIKEGMSLMDELSSFTTRTANLFELRIKVFEWMKKVLNVLERKKEEHTHNPVYAAKQWISQNLAQNITIKKIADYVYMNPTYFCELFKNETDETVLDYVTRLRLETARELLTRKDLKVYDVAKMVGYADAKYFSKLFKKHYGETPSTYKEKIILERS